MEKALELLGDCLETFQVEAPGAVQEIRLAPEAKKRFRPIARNQLMMRPLDVEKLVEDDHPVRAIWAMVCQLDWSRFEEDVKVLEGGKGRSNYDPRLLAALWIYGYSEAVNSARELSRMCGYEPGCEWLTGMEEVNYHTLADFRTRDKKALEALFVQVLGVLSAEGLTDLKRVMQDGTKIKAQASGNSFRRENKIQEHLKLAQEQIEAMDNPESDENSQRVFQARQRGAREKKQRLEQALEELKKLEETRKESESKCGYPDFCILHIPEYRAKVPAPGP